MIRDDLPDEIKTFLQRHILHEQSLAYLRVSSNGVLIDCGGRLETFGLSGIRPGNRVDEQVDLSKMFRTGNAVYRHYATGQEAPTIVLEWEGGEARDAAGGLRQRLARGK